jgi:mono/diheme cytochrome c family protein
LVEAVVEGGARLPANIGGTSDMPAFGELLTDEEITAVLAYIKSSWPEDIPQAQWEQSAADPLQ